MMRKPSTLRLIAHGIGRRRSRSYAMMACFALITGSLLGSSILIGAAGTSVSVGLDRMGADLAVVPEEYADLTNATGSEGGMSMGGEGAQGQLTLYTVKPVGAYLAGSEIDRVRNISGVAQASPQLCIPVITSTVTQVIGFDPDTDFTIQPWVEDGRPGPLRPGDALVGCLVAVSNGSTVEVLGHQLNVTARLDPTGTALDRSVLMGLEELRSIAPADSGGSGNVTLGSGGVSAIMIRKAPNADPDSLAENLTAAISGSSTVAPSRLASNMAEQFSGIGSSLVLAALIVAVVMVPQVALVSTMASNERRGEYGTLRALGGTRRFLFILVLGEALAIALIGGALGTIGAGLTFMIIERQLGTAFLGPFIWPSAWALALDMAAALSAALLVGGTAALYPAYKASKCEPYEAIRTGE